jgi:adenosine deaminase
VPEPVSAPEPAPATEHECGRDLRALPKAHLHVHLESAVRWPTIEEISAANGQPFPAHLTAGDHAFPDFADFFRQNDMVRACLRRAGDFRRIAYEYCADEAAQGTRYAELTFSAAAHGERVGDLEMPLYAVLEGLALGQQRYGLECRLILDHSRRRPVARAWRTLELAQRYAADGVVAVGLAGDEDFPAAPFVEVFDAARRAGLRVVHHAGEACGPASVREAIGPGRSERLGHGIRVLDDDGLVAEVRRRAIALEVCPSSNVALGFAPSWAAHPLPRLRAAGLVVTLNTDVPALVGTALAEEYRRARRVFGYDDEVLAELARNAADASFAPTATKARLRAGIDEWLATYPTTS